MSIASVKPCMTDPAARATGSRGSAEAGAFAAVARSVAAGDLVAARAALSATRSTSATAATLSQSLDAGNLAAARLALLQLGADPYAMGSLTRHASDGGAPSSTGTSTPVPPTRVASVTGSPKIAAAAAGPVGPGAPAANAAGGSTSQHGATTMITDAGSLATSGSTTYSVADVMLALATGNAGNIPADVINLYGPGGARYDPAAIMDAYRGSDIGKAQMALSAWMGKQA